MATEKLKFKLKLYAIMWDSFPETIGTLATRRRGGKPPVAEITVGGKSYFKGDITAYEKEPALIEFEAELTEGQDYELVIHRSGKDKGETIVNDKGDIIKDQLLGIKGIEIDEIDIGSLIYSGVYKPEYPEPWATQQKKQGHELKASFTNVTQMGHNGTWTFGFTSPFYMWLLENLY